MKASTLSVAFLSAIMARNGFAFLAPSTSAHTSRLSPLFSLNKLVESIADSSSCRTVFVGGKGGVGKTTVSSALAVSLASSFENDVKVLVVSTDPAHSLGDALDVDLRASMGKPVLMTDPLTGGKLHACEIDATAALDSFRESLSAFDVTKLADALGVSPDLLVSFGL